MNVSGCTLLEEGAGLLEDGCSLHHSAEAIFTTRTGPPAQAVPPTVEFVNSTLVKIAWSSQFQVSTTVELRVA